MVVEDAVKPSALEVHSGIAMAANPNPRARADEEDDEPEEGEIVGDEELGSSRPSKGIAHQPHPLEHSWTFWFDNPSAKSKQAAWGSSIRPIYTFNTVEEFWRFFLFPSILFLLFLVVYVFFVVGGGLLWKG